MGYKQLSDTLLVPYPMIESERDRASKIEREREREKKRVGESDDFYKILELTIFC